MTQTSSTEVIADRVRHLMARKQWTAQDLADALAAVGVDWTRLVVANLLVKKADRRRRYVTVDELLALAYVLDVAPIHLLIPIDDESGQYWYVATEGMANWMVRDWARGRLPMPGQDKRVYFSEVPEKEWRVDEDLSTRPITKDNDYGER